MFGEMIRFIRKNPSSPSIMSNLNKLQPCTPFYFNNSKFSDYSEISVREMLSIQVTQSLFLCEI